MGPQLGGAAPATWDGGQRGENPPRTETPGGESTEPSGKLGLTWRLTGHLDEMRSWSNRGVTGREEMWASCSHWRPGTLEQLLGMVAVRENRCEVPSMLGTKEAFHN